MPKKKSSIFTPQMHFLHSYYLFGELVVDDFSHHIQACFICMLSILYIPGIKRTFSDCPHGKGLINNLYLLSQGAYNEN